MKRIFAIILVAVSSFFVSCDDDLENEDFDVVENFNFLWKEIDEKYCFFDYKKDSIMRWDLVYDKYLPKVYYDCDNVTEYFDILAAMLGELKDGHVNLYTSFDVSRYDFADNTPIDFDYNVVNYNDRYLGKDTRSVGGFKYKTLRDGKVGYIYYGSFSSSFSSGNINNILDSFEDTEGLIIDVRSNGGGSIANVNALVSHFIDETTVIGYRVNKTGPGHSDFSSPVAEKVFDLWRYGQSAYIPSVAQMRLLYQARDAINPYIVKCGGTPIPDDENDCWYWTSTEVKGQETAKSWLFSLGSGAIQETPKWQAHKARPVITLNE